MLQLGGHYDEFDDKAFLLLVIRDVLDQLPRIMKTVVKAAPSVDTDWDIGFLSVFEKINGCRDQIEQWAKEQTFNQ